jgi:hypothetical protein
VATEVDRRPDRVSGSEWLRDVLGCPLWTQSKNDPVRILRTVATPHVKSLVVRLAVGAPMLGLRGAFIPTFHSRDLAACSKGFNAKVSRAGGKRLYASLQMPFVVGFHEAAATLFETQGRAAWSTSELIGGRIWVVAPHRVNRFGSNRRSISQSSSSSSSTKSSAST